MAVSKANKTILGSVGDSLAPSIDSSSPSSSRRSLGRLFLGLLISLTELSILIDQSRRAVSITCPSRFSSLFTVVPQTIVNLDSLYAAKSEDLSVARSLLEIARLSKPLILDRSCMKPNFRTDTSVKYL